MVEGDVWADTGGGASGVTPEITSGVGVGEAEAEAVGEGEGDASGVAVGVGVGVAVGVGVGVAVGVGVGVGVTGGTTRKSQLFEQSLLKPKSLRVTVTDFS